MILPVAGQWKSSAAQLAILVAVEGVIGEEEDVVVGEEEEEADVVVGEEEADVVVVVVEMDEVV